MQKITNIGASNFRKLLHQARENKIDFNTLLKRYLQERFLYRLSKSTYKDNFILKGGLLLITIDIPASRPTMDIDLLIHKLGNEQILKAFREILSIEYPDGVIFDSDSLQSEPITKDGAYQGTRLKFKAYFNGSRNDMSIDLGLGDYVLNSRKIVFPTILDEDKPILTAYSLETIIAEKLEAMAKLLYSNSRMKDFYDVYTILSTHKLSKTTLKKAIKGTFEHRQTPYADLQIIFSSDFYELPDKQTQWVAFLNKSKIVNVPTEFSKIVKTIEKCLGDIKL
ncbi:MAG: nucleotidyl transferase AbiEii/AbiGii toxin family protein [Elusimicrobiaceae bacterium]|nr:nucleotidyl transferase AbiEii/AbiGii toxin family protein [Elusimicrobiaceae bacterium]